jgi:sigma-B regulation protein RsbU (phosphoserine phosphatase)
MTATPADNAGADSNSSPSAATRTLQRRILTLVALLNIAGTAAGCALAYHYQKKAFLHGIDRVLTTGAIGAQHVFGDRFQQEVLQGRKFTPQEELAHIRSISNFSERLNLTYIGALVRRDGKYFYTISSSPEYELQDGTYERIWAEYKDPTPALAATFNDGRPRFEDHEDQFGRFRSAYIAFDMPGGGSVDYVYMADIGLDYIYTHLHQTLALTALAGLAISAFSLWFTWILAKHLAGPMAKLAEVICSVTLKDCRLADEQRATLGAISTRSYREIAAVSSAFIRMERRLRDYIAELAHTTAERERIASELSIAHDIQMGLLPRKLPQLAGCDVFAQVIPAKEVGGDLFDVAEMADGRLLLVVADVSGKGVSAGMFMAVAKTLLDVAAGTFTEPEEIVTFLNDRLAAENEACMFVTMFLAIFDPQSGELHYTNGGHNPPYIRRAGGSLESLTGRHGMALGIAPDQPYTSETATLHSGDLLTLYSDGVTEAQDVSESLFSEERLEKCLAPLQSEDAGEAAAAVIDRVRQFQGAAAQFDDITIVTLRYAGEKTETQRDRQQDNADSSGASHETALA